VWTPSPFLVGTAKMVKINRCIYPNKGFLSFGTNKELVPNIGSFYIGIFTSIEDQAKMQELGLKELYDQLTNIPCVTDVIIRRYEFGVSVSDAFSEDAIEIERILTDVKRIATDHLFRGEEIVWGEVDLKDRYKGSSHDDFDTLGE
jgi:hypothetical protein